MTPRIIGQQAVIPPGRRVRVWGGGTKANSALHNRNGSVTPWQINRIVDATEWRDVDVVIGLFGTGTWAHTAMGAATALTNGITVGRLSLLTGSVMQTPGLMTNADLVMHGRVEPQAGLTANALVARFRVADVLRLATRDVTQVLVNDDLTGSPWNVSLFGWVAVEYTEVPL